VVDRTKALAHIVDLAKQHGLSSAEIGEALGVDGASAVALRRRGVLVQVLSFIGGTFVFAGVGVFVALQWESMNAAARVIVTFGSGLSAFVLAVLASRDVRLDKAATPLFLVAGALEPTGMLVLFDEFGTGGDWRWASLVTSGTMALQFAATLAPLGRSTLLFLCVFFAALFWWTVLDLMGAESGIVALAVGGGLLATAIAVDRTAWYLFGAAGVLYGLFDAVEGTPLEVGFLIAAAGLVYLSVALRSRMVLGVSTLAIIAYTAWFTERHFADSLGWPIALIIFGLLLIGLSAVAFRIDRDYVRPAGT
jgi:hypothetical protein